MSSTSTCGADVSRRPLGRLLSSRSGSLRSACSRGFTLIELITCIIIMGILSAMVAPQFFNGAPFSERGYADELAYAMRYAQKIAIATQCPVAVTSTAAGYTGMQRQRGATNTCRTAGAFDLQVQRSDGTNLAGTVPDEVVVAPDAVIEFNALGGISGGAPPLTIGTHTVRVDEISGLVSVQ